MLTFRRHENHDFEQFEEIGLRWSDSEEWEGRGWRRGAMGRRSMKRRRRKGRKKGEEEEKGEKRGRRKGRKKREGKQRRERRQKRRKGEGGDEKFEQRPNNEMPFLVLPSSMVSEFSQHDLKYFTPYASLLDETVNIHSSPLAKKALPLVHDTQSQPYPVNSHPINHLIGALS